MFGGAILADAVGLGKTYVALALAERYRSVTVSTPASLKSQWSKIAAKFGIPITLISHESLSRSGSVPSSSLIIVDEAHWFRNPTTRRYDRLARGVGLADVLLVTATPVVNKPSDLVHLLRLFLPDNGLSACGLKSIERMVDPTELADASSSLMVSRSSRCLPPSTAIPRAFDDVFCASPLPENAQTIVLDLVSRLQFPNFGASTVQQLLRKHMLLRLSSSRDALLETLKRHLRYVRRAAAGHESGPPSRRLIRSLFGNSDEFQLDLLAALSGSVISRVDRLRLKREEELLLAINDVVNSSGHDPKVQLLKEYLQSCRGKTVVFTSATATAVSICRALDWKRVAMATGGGARIASGRISFQTALDLFSPRSRSLPDSPEAARVSTLVATDVASEGLNLQDASTVVHYDLPWNPLRLQQRTGRIRRLGSHHTRVSIAWFLPTPQVDKLLDILALIDKKSHTQTLLGVATTSRVGKSDQYNRIVETRENLFAAGTPGHTDVGWCVVRGPSLAVCCLLWEFSCGKMLETLVATENGVSGDIRLVDSTIRRLASKSESDRPPPYWLKKTIVDHIQRRIVASRTGPTNVRNLSRHILKLGRSAGREGDYASLAALDRLLDTVQTGVPAGTERIVVELLKGGGSLDLLAIRKPKPGRFLSVKIVATLVGDGTDFRT